MSETTGEAAVAPASAERAARRLPLRARIVLALFAVCATAGLAAAFVNPVGLQRAAFRWELRLHGLDHRTLSAPRGPLSYWEGGEGATMVLVHGLGNDAGIWGRVVASLREGHRLLVPDLPGHGASAPATGPLGIADELAGLEVLIEKRVRDEPVVLVGNSLGGWIALLYAEKHPERVARLVLVDNAGFMIPPSVPFVVRNRDEARQLTRALLGPDVPDLPGFVLDDVVEKVQTGPSPRIFKSFQPEDFLERRLAKIDVPADIIWGTADGLFPVDLGRRFARELPRSRFHLLPACGHTPQAECPERFAKLLRWILQEPPPPPVEEVPDEPWRDPGSARGSLSRAP